MKYRALISLWFMLYACSAGATMYLFSGSDAYGPGLSYPGYGSSLSLTSFVADNNTTRVSPVFLTATIFRPEFRFLGSVNRSNYYHPILPKWDQFNFYLPLPGMEEFFGNYDTRSSSRERISQGRLQASRFELRHAGYKAVRAAGQILRRSGRA